MHQAIVNETDSTKGTQLGRFASMWISCVSNRGNFCLCVIRKASPWHSYPKEAPSCSRVPDSSIPILPRENFHNEEKDQVTLGPFSSLWSLVCYNWVYVAVHRLCLVCSCVGTPFFATASARQLTSSPSCGSASAGGNRRSFSSQVRWRNDTAKLVILTYCIIVPALDWESFVLFYFQWGTRSAFRQMCGDRNVTPITCCSICINLHQKDAYVLFCDLV